MKRSWSSRPGAWRGPEEHDPVRHAQRAPLVVTVDDRRASDRERADLRLANSALKSEVAFWRCCATLAWAGLVALLVWRLTR